MSTDSTSSELAVAIEPRDNSELNEEVIFAQSQPTSDVENQNDEPPNSTQNTQKPETTGLMKLLDSCDTSNYPYPILGALAILIRVISYIFIFASCLICAKIALFIALIKFCFTQKSEEKRFSNIIKYIRRLDNFTRSSFDIFLLPDNSSIDLRYRSTRAPLFFSIF